MRPDDTYPQLMAAMTTTGIRWPSSDGRPGAGDEPLERHMAEVFGLLKGELAVVHGINGSVALSALSHFRW